jgi:general secretion pathway protein G
MTVVAVFLAALAAFAIPNYMESVERARIARAMGDIHVIQQNTHEYYLSNGSYPNSLHDIGMGNLTDAWGNSYAYLAVEGAQTEDLRKDRLGTPLNSDFDLYSRGPDGQSDPLLTASVSRDDIIRGLNGSFVGIPTDSLSAPLPGPDQGRPGLRVLPPKR